MLKSFQKFTHAVEAILDIAAYDLPIRGKEIAKRQHIPERYLEPVMQQLVKADILKSVRGPKGGYTLARERRKITAGEIFSAIYKEECESISLTELSKVAILPLWQSAAQAMIARLQTVTIHDLYEQARKLGPQKGLAQKSDFII